MLRPELVLSNPVPLCSDAFSGFQASDPDRLVHNAEVKAATETLTLKFIPELAAFLVAQKKASFRDLSLSVEFHRYDRETFLRERERKIKTDLGRHRKGVNMRHMGLVRKIVSELQGPRKGQVMQVMLQDMILRVCKNMIRRQMRQRMLKLCYSRDEPFKQILVGFLNLLGTSPTILYIL